MPRKDTEEYRAYMREYMRAKRQGLTGINTILNVGARGLEPPTSASRTLRATRLRYAPPSLIISGFNFWGKHCKLVSVYSVDLNIR